MLYALSPRYVETGKAAILAAGGEPSAAMLFGLLFFVEVPSPLSLAGLVLTVIALSFPCAPGREEAPPVRRNGPPLHPHLPLSRPSPGRPPPGSVLPHVLYALSLRDVETGKAAILAAGGEPSAAMLFGLLFFAEVPTVLSLAGLVLTVIAL